MQKINEQCTCKCITTITNKPALNLFRPQYIYCQLVKIHDEKLVFTASQREPFYTSIILRDIYVTERFQ